MDDREQQRKIRHRLAVLRHAEEVSGNVAATCRYEVGERYPILWPSGTEWDANDQSIVTSRGQSLPLGGEVRGGGGYLYVDDVDRLAGSDAADLARECVDNTFGEIAIVNNSGSAVGRP